MKPLTVKPSPFARRLSFWGVIYRRKYIVGGSCGFGLLAAATITLTSPTLFLGTATIKDEYIQSDNPIDRLVVKFSNNGLWKNGSYSDLKLSIDASTEELVASFFKVQSFDQGTVKRYKILESRLVRIPEQGRRPNLYTATRIKTDFGEKVVLFQFEQSYWWSRSYDLGEI